MGCEKEHQVELMVHALVKELEQEASGCQIAELRNKLRLTA